MIAALQQAPCRARAVLAVFGFWLLVLFGMAIHAAMAGSGSDAEAVRFSEALELTDLALFTEARYTRNPSQADLQSPFQDHPMSFDHFPSGSLMAPPHFPSSGTISADRKENRP